jgi:hypothetical protein
MCISLLRRRYSGSCCARPVPRQGATDKPSCRVGNQAYDEWIHSSYSLVAWNFREYSSAGSKCLSLPIPEAPLRIQSATITIAHAVTVAAAVFGPGHLGEFDPVSALRAADEALRPGMFTLRGGRAGRRLPGFAGR